MIKRILNQFMNKIHTYDTSIDENYFRIPRYLFYEAIEELEEDLKGIQEDKEATNKCYPIDIAVNNCYSPFDNSHEYLKVCSHCLKEIEYKSDWVFCPYCGYQFE